MPSTDLGLGLGAGGALTAIVYLVDRIFNTKKSIKAVDGQFKTFGKKLDKDIKELFAKIAENSGVLKQLVDWHNVADPEDPSGKLWYFGVTQRKALSSLEINVEELLELLEELVRRFDRYNETLEKLVTVAERLDKSVTKLSILFHGFRV